MIAPFLQAAGPAALPSAVVAFHKSPGCFSGEVTVRHGKGLWSAAMIRFGGFPPESTKIPFSVEITRSTGAERWVRDFDGHKTVSVLRYAGQGNCVNEQFGPLFCRLALTAQGDHLSADVVGIRALGVPLPVRWLLRTQAKEWQISPDVMGFDVAAFHGSGALLLQYRGWIRTQL